MLTLCDQRGGCLAVPSEDWSQLLSIAREYGWVPAGTRRPPISFDLAAVESGAWDGNYEIPEGQVVTRTDAEHLRFALQDAAEASGRTAYGTGWISPVVKFLRESFTISRDTPELHPFAGVHYAANAVSELAAVGYLPQR